MSSGSGVSDERGSNQDELSAASTHAAATLQMHLMPEVRVRVRVRVRARARARVRVRVRVRVKVKG